MKASDKKFANRLTELRLLFIQPLADSGVSGPTTSAYLHRWGMMVNINLSWFRLPWYLVSMFAQLYLGVLPQLLL